MGIINIGIDMEDINRFRNIPFEQNKSFYDRIFTDAEIKYSLSKADPYPSLTARFCAKEAFIKAFPIKINDYKSIEVTFVGEKPTILWKDYKVHLSLSHEKDKALAFVIIESLEK